MENHIGEARFLSYPQAMPMNIIQATTAYERWLGKRIPLLDGDLRLKHTRMAESPFPFLRATFYRWVQLWPEVCPELARAPLVLAIGDLHIENFGTWRDCEGRLLWGINDFDEAERMPYTIDLVRLAVSAKLAIKENGLSCDPFEACDSLLLGYEEALQRGGGPLVLAEKHAWLRHLAISELRDPTTYWNKLDQLPTVKNKVPGEVQSILAAAFPEPRLKFRVIHRQAGLGSLGRRRFTALTRWKGGMIAREAKELTQSAWHWEEAAKDSTIRYEMALKQAVRVPDPFLARRGRWIVRRLAPDCSRVELATLPKSGEELKLLRAMGWETANIHLGTKPAVRRIVQDLKKRPAKWLHKAIEAMSEAVMADWKQWRA